MQYLLLIYSAEGSGPVYETPEFGKLMEGYMAMTEEAKQNNVFEGGNALQAVETATSVRVRNGKTETIDGPFAETKEQLGGYYLMNCKDLDEALYYASKIPTAEFGTIEVRPVWEL
ncbi:MAG: YciI family protein [Proteobacteria bacterium]|nr:YciI family protein [Pseudomonadota bacterium]